MNCFTETLGWVAVKLKLQRASQESKQLEIHYLQRSIQERLQEQNCCICLALSAVSKIDNRSGVREPSTRWYIWWSWNSQNRKQQNFKNTRRILYRMWKSSNSFRQNSMIWNFGFYYDKPLERGHISVKRSWVFSHVFKSHCDTNPLDTNPLGTHTNITTSIHRYRTEICIFSDDGLRLEPRRTVFVAIAKTTSLKIYCRQRWQRTFMQIRSPGMTGKESWNYFHQFTFPTMFVAEGQEPIDDGEFRGDLWAFRKTSVPNSGFPCEDFAGNTSMTDFLGICSSLRILGPSSHVLNVLTFLQGFFIFLCVLLCSSWQKNEKRYSQRWIRDDILSMRNLGCNS